VDNFQTTFALLIIHFTNSTRNLFYIYLTNLNDIYLVQLFKFFRQFPLDTFYIPCDQQLFRSKKALKSWPYVDKDGSISGCIYPFQFKFGNFCRNWDK
jgi:hypothetical protein